MEADTAGPQYDDLIGSLRTAYNSSAAERDSYDKSLWKLAERTAFLQRLQAEGSRRLLEIGAGTGQDSAYFLSEGLAVKATDLSPEMVERCRQKGIDAQVMDFLHLDYPVASFDAVYAMNCLLHVPNADLPQVLSAVRDLLRPGGLFFLGVYGGRTSEGVADWDRHDPPRFFSMRSDEQIQAFAAAAFTVVDFHVVGEDDHRFQSLTLRRPE